MSAHLLGSPSRPLPLEHLSLGLYCRSPALLSLAPQRNLQPRNRDLRRGSCGMEFSDLQSRQEVGGGMREGNLEWQVEEGTVSPI